jgi:hypothetical protein
MLKYRLVAANLRNEKECYVTKATGPSKADVSEKLN